MTQKVSAPSVVRKQPEIFCLTLGMRTACSATLLVNGTAGSFMKRQTSSAYSRRRRSRLAGLLCLVAPRLPEAAARGLKIGRASCRERGGGGGVGVVVT